jgi:iron complex outermembrane receptor protein
MSISVRRHRVAMAVLASASLPLQAQTTPSEDAPTKTLGVVTVTGPRPTSLPTQIPTTTEGITREDIARTVNATDSEDALKYFPSLLVRKRYIGDYNHAILSSRASGTGNSARSAVYADGVLLSNYLGNGVGGLSFPPRWGLVTPEEIDRVDVMYGPFSAAYPGNSVGAVVDYVTRMPTKFEAHAKVGYVLQPFELYDTKENYKSWQSSASLGNRAGDWAWFLNLSHTDSESQPLTFATRTVGAPSAGGQPVSGAVPDNNTANQPMYVLGTGTQYHIKQDHLKAKLAYDFSSTLRASYVFGLWRNTSDGNSQSYLRDAGGNPVYANAVNIDGHAYTLIGGDFAVTRESLVHTMHGLSIKSHTRGEWDWELAASLYSYDRDDKRQNAAGSLTPTVIIGNPQPGASSGGVGTLADGSGSGWNTLALKGTWRPPQAAGAHVVDFGVQQDSYQLRYQVMNVLGNYLSDGGDSLASGARGDTRLRSVWAQDAWQLAADWKTVLGLRAENWTATAGRTDFAGTPSTPPAPSASSTSYPERSENALSPKAALSWQWLPDTLLKTSLGRAVRMPTVNELYGATSSTNTLYINDPNLKPEKSWTWELSAEQDFERALVRLTAFAEDTHDSIYSQTTVTPGGNIARVQNVDRVSTKGIEAVASTTGLGLRGLDLSGSVTYADSRIKENSGYVQNPGDTVGKQQPNIPRWRATALASYRFDPDWTGALGWRYSGRQYRTLNNADVNGNTYTGVSQFSVFDLRLTWKIDRQWSAAFGIDNVGNDKYWNFHPYPQRSYSAELKFDL